MSRLCVVQLRQKEGVVADLDLGVHLGSLRLARPWSFRPSLADVSWVAWPSN
jgi:hypothetical protein